MDLERMMPREKKDKCYMISPICGTSSGHSQRESMVVVAEGRQEEEAMGGL
jgi:hypothetical protein